MSARSLAASPRARSSKAPRRRVAAEQLQLPQYSILQQLGESSRAVVYLARSTALGHNVALKISKPAQRERAAAGQEFAREFAALCALRNRCVVEIYDYGFHDGHEFIAMEYFPCGDLQTRLQLPLTTAQCLEFAQRLCGALQVVHAAGLVHRDLKPQNVMLREDGSVVLIDFGIAKGDGLGCASTIIGVLRGSPYYMSPEQVQGLPLDARCDLYSVGVMLYEMLSGRKPYTGSTAVELMQQHVQGPRPALPAGCARLEPLLERLMARDPSARFSDASAAREALAHAITELAAAQPDATAASQ
jgi:serine/threonine-protein kinase PpkA